MTQRTRTGEPRKITRYEIRWRNGPEGQRTGVFYINYPKKSQAIAKKRQLVRDFPRAQWRIIKTKKNVWIRRTNG